MNYESISISIVKHTPDKNCVVRFKKRQHNLSDLDLLAKHWSTLFGKALDPSSITGVQGLLLSRSGRPDWIDCKSLEIQRALLAMDRLYQIYTVPKTKQSAEILLYARVVCGDEVRLLGTMYLKIALAYRSAPKKMTPTKEKVLISAGKKLYDLACAAYKGFPRTHGDSF